VASRLLSDAISRSDGVARLSPKALSLFCLLLPHLNAHGKMAAEVGVVKGLVAPKIRWLTPRVIGRCLEEISQHTNVKWFKDADGLMYVHAISWKKYQRGLRVDRLGEDRLPSYKTDQSSTSPGLLPESSLPEVEVEVEGKVKEKNKVKEKVKGNGEAETPTHFLSDSFSNHEFKTEEQLEPRRNLLKEQAEKLGGSPR
jgi:hypothetical protein